MGLFVLHAEKVAARVGGVLVRNAEGLDIGREAGDF